MSEKVSGTHRWYGPWKGKDLCRKYGPAETDLNLTLTLRTLGPGPHSLFKIVEKFNETRDSTYRLELSKKTARASASRQVTRGVWKKTGRDFELPYPGLLQNDVYIGGGDTVVGVMNCEAGMTSTAVCLVSKKTSSEKKTMDAGFLNHVLARATEVEKLKKSPDVVEKLQELKQARKKTGPKSQL